MKYTFIVEDEGYKVEHTFTAIHVEDILRQFTSFMHGSGFTWIEPGTIVHDPEVSELKN